VDTDPVEIPLSPESLRAIAELQGASAPLDVLRGIRSVIAVLDSEPALLASVRAALDAGSTWDDIALAAGLKPAAAKWRWQGSDEEIAARLDAGRKRSTRPSSVPTDLPGVSVAEAAKTLGVSAQAIYLRVTRGTLRAETVTLDDGRSYKRVHLDE
jgi:transposase-like protein